MWAWGFGGVIVFMARLVADKVGVWRGAGPGRRQVVRDVSLQVASGELFGLLGPNGAGKTSLLSALSGLEVPGSGEVWLEGEPLAPTPPGRVGWVTQDPHFFCHLRVRELLPFLGNPSGSAGARRHCLV